MAADRRVDDCGLTACTPGSAPGPTLGIEYGKPLPFLLILLLRTLLPSQIMKEQSPTELLPFRQDVVALVLATYCTVVHV